MNQSLNTDKAITLAKERVLRILEVAKPNDYNDRDDICATLSALAAAYVAACKHQGVNREDSLRGIVEVWIEGDKLGATNGSQEPVKGKDD